MAKNKKLLRLIIPLAAAVIIVILFGLMIARKKPIKLEFQKGIGYVSWSRDAYLSSSSDESLARISGLGADWVSMLVTWYQTNIRSGDIRRTDKTPSDESLVHAIRKAHELGMKVMLKLHLDILDKSDGSWRGEIGGVKEADWESWFREYRDYLMHYVDIANKEKVEMICIGTELSTAATTKGYLWIDLIKKIRAKYKGLLTYAAHWDRYQDIRFWDFLDYVGINPYFPLTEKMSPPYEELRSALEERVAEIEEFQKAVDKPIILPEIGCASADGAAIRPWEHVPRSEVNLKLQEDYYRAIFAAFWDKEWFYGLYWWYWGTNVNMGGEFNRGFTLQNKPAEKLVKEWYTKAAGK